MENKEYLKLKKWWENLIARDTKDNYEFFNEKENDLQSMIPLLLKYKQSGDKENYSKIVNAFFSKQARWGFCGLDLSNLDLSMLSADSLARITFDTSTKWPPKIKLPKGFNPTDILQRAKTHKGLGVEELHTKGINGLGVKVSYIDKGFDVEHEEFVGRKITYINLQNCERYDFHGYAVASRLIGKNIGIAPEVDLIYYNCEGEEKNYITSNIEHEMNALKDILIRLKNGEKIVAVGISASIPYHFDIALERKEIDENKKTEFFEKYITLKNELKKYDCQIISSEEFWDDMFSYAYKIKPLDNNLDLENYAQYGKPNESCAVIEADKVVPSAYTKNGYKYENTMGSASWSIPQVVGLYCLVKQANPEISYEQFVKLCHETSHQPNINSVRQINAISLLEKVKHKSQISQSVL